MVWQTKTIFLFVALPVFTICAAALLFAHRKDKEWEDYLTNLRLKRIEVKIPIENVGNVIGRAGANIKEIQEKTNTKINFRDPEDDKEYRICKIKGTKENVERAQEMILEIVTSQAAIKTFEMFVPMKSCGRIIGRCGDTIRAISKASNASITVDRTTSAKGDSLQKLVVIKGNDEQIAAAKELIENKIAEEEVARNKMHLTLSNRSPRMRPKKSKNILEDKKELRYERLMASMNDNMIQVYVSSVASPMHFWLQLITPKAGDLDHLVENMTDYYCKKENRNNHSLTKVSKGQIVAVKLQTDDKWYRVEVCDVKDEEEDQNPETEVDVFFVDYGDSSYEKLKDLYQLRTDFLSLRFQAIEASMVGIAPKDSDEWSEESTTAFEDLVFTGQWKALMAQVVEYKPRTKSNREGSPLPCVRLFNSDGPPGVDIAKKLMDSGFAVPLLKPDANQETVIESESSVKIEGKEDTETNEPVNQNDLSLNKSVELKSPSSAVDETPSYPNDPSQNKLTDEITLSPNKSLEEFNLNQNKTTDKSIDESLLSHNKSSDEANLSSNILTISDTLSPETSPNETIFEDSSLHYDQNISTPSRDQNSSNPAAHSTLKKINVGEDNDETVIQVDDTIDEITIQSEGTFDEDELFKSFVDSRTKENVFYMGKEEFPSENVMKSDKQITSEKLISKEKKDF